MGTLVSRLLGGYFLVSMGRWKSGCHERQVSTLWLTSTKLGTGRSHLWLQVKFSMCTTIETRNDISGAP